MAFCAIFVAIASLQFSGCTLRQSQSETQIEMLRLTGLSADENGQSFNEQSVANFNQESLVEERAKLGTLFQTQQPQSEHLDQTASDAAIYAGILP